jgi:hypothetical protein
MIALWIGGALAVLVLSTGFALGVGRVIAAREKQVPVYTDWEE